MKTLIKNGLVINVFTDAIEKKNVLIEDEKIIGVGSYDDADADVIFDAEGKYISPGFIDGHIHIESTMLTPGELANACVPHGTTSIIADPHEIANVSGIEGIEYMIQKSENIPLHVYIMLPSCVPATPFDESGAILSAEDLSPLYDEKRVLGLAEMMNYPGLLAGVPDVLQKVTDAVVRNKAVDGHAPMLTGRELDKYIAAGVGSDHECTNLEEAIEKLSKGQWIMIREGTAAKNLIELSPLMDKPYDHRCLLVTDDRHPADILEKGHIDNIIRKAVKLGKSPVVAIRMASIQAATYFGIKNVGAVAPGYRADINIIEDLETIKITNVFSAGKHTVIDGKMCEFSNPLANEKLENKVRNSFNMGEITKKDVYIEPVGTRCRVINVIPGQLLTNETIESMDMSVNNGIDVSRDILKLAVLERHNGTGHKGLGYIKGIGLKSGAIASSVSHDSHNLIIIGTNDDDIVTVAECVRKMGGGLAVCNNGKITATMPLPIAGLMSDETAQDVADQNEKVRLAAKELGANAGVEPFMNMAFVSLPVIPSIKMSPNGLVNVDTFSKVDLFC